jgi:pimeloyl-ACP methyl ester carboxylesterase
MLIRHSRLINSKGGHIVVPNRNTQPQECGDDEVSENPEIGKSTLVRGLQTNYHDVGSGTPVLLIHGSGPGVTAWANWRGTIPVLSQHGRVIAPDMAGFGYTDRFDDGRYGLDRWVDHIFGLLDTLDIQSAHVIGNSFGGALALAMAAREPARVQRLVLMGSVGVSFPITEGLDAVWGYTPSLENMQRVMRYFAFDQSRLTPALAQMRYEASTRPGCSEAFAQMFPAPRQRWVEAMTTPNSAIKALHHETLIVHGRDDQVIPTETSFALHEPIERSQLHMFGRCGHWTQIEQADRFNKLVADFLFKESEGS